MSKQMIVIITGFAIVLAMLRDIKRDLSAMLEENSAVANTVAINKL